MIEVKEMFFDFQNPVFNDFRTTLRSYGITEVQFAYSDSEIVAKVTQIKIFKGESIIINLAYDDTQIEITKNNILYYNRSGRYDLKSVVIYYVTDRVTTFENRLLLPSRNAQKVEANNNV